MVCYINQTRKLLDFSVDLVNWSASMILGSYIFTGLCLMLGYTVLNKWYGMFMKPRRDKSKPIRTEFAYIRLLI